VGRLRRGGGRSGGRRRFRWSPRHAQEIADQNFCHPLRAPAPTLTSEWSQSLPERPHAPMVTSRPHSAFCLLAWLIFACGAKPGGDADASPREASGGTTAELGVSAGTSTSNEGGAANLGGAANTGGATNAGGATSTGGATSPGGAANTGGAGSAAGASGDFEQDCLAVAADSCEQCLCSSCTDQLRACADTEGCPELAVCIRDNHCKGIACYCGTFDPVACANGEANGPCKSAILDAPGGRVPTLLSPSAGPASDAAVAISHCQQSGQPCAQACSSR
jgi:hypothetical protein